MYDRNNPGLLDVLALDDTLPIDSTVKEYWIRNLKSPLRRGPLSLIRIVRTLSLYVFYFFRRILPFQFSFPVLLQRIICSFMRNFITPEANYLILNHFWTESNLVNFIIANSRNRHVEPLVLYPKTIEDLMTFTFVKHDIVLFNALHDLGNTEGEKWPVRREDLEFSTMREIQIDLDLGKRKWTQFVDFETSHELFKATFCLLLSWKEYERSIVGLQFDHTLVLRVSRILGDPTITELSANSHPLFFMGPTGIGYRFILHGLFVEYVHEHLVRLRARSRKKQMSSQSSSGGGG